MSLSTAYVARVCTQCTQPPIQARPSKSLAGGPWLGRQLRCNRDAHTWAPAALLRSATRGGAAPFGGSAAGFGNDKVLGRAAANTWAEEFSSLLRMCRSLGLDVTQAWGQEVIDK